MKIVISAESTVDLTKELLEKYQIPTIPFQIFLGDKNGFEVKNVYPTHTDFSDSEPSLDSDRPRKRSERAENDDVTKSLQFKGCFWAKRSTNFHEISHI